MSKISDSFSDKANEKIEAAQVILKDIGLPVAQHNERSALTLLALLDLRPNMLWSDANSPLIGITPIMEFIAKHYDKKYKPNTRETIRRQTVHQFVEAGILIKNPDKLSRPPNSPKTVYQIEENVLELFVLIKILSRNKNILVSRTLKRYAGFLGLSSDRLSLCRREDKMCW